MHDRALTLGALSATAQVRLTLAVRLQHWAVWAEAPVIKHDHFDHYGGHRAALHRYLCRLIHDEDTAQDLTAVTLNSVQQGRPGVGEEEAS